MDTPNSTNMVLTVYFSRRIHRCRYVTQSTEHNGAWVDKYIFPGGYAPQLHELTQELWAAKLSVAHCENLKPHYAETMKRWASNLIPKNKDCFIRFTL